MTMPGQGNQSFGDALESAQTSPMDVRGRDGFDGYPAPRGVVKDGDQELPQQSARPTMNKATGFTDHKATMERAVYVIWRHYGGCDRCTEDIKGGAVNLPDTGDITCPHVQLTEYKQVMNRCLAGDYALQGEVENVLKDGTIVVSLKWIVPVMVARTAKERQRKPPRNAP